MPRELSAFGAVEAAGSAFNGKAATLLGRPIASGAVASQSAHLDALARGWWKALESAHSALRGAGPYLSWKELSERSSRLAEERSTVARLLQSLARDLQADGTYVRWLAAPTSL